MARRGLIWLLLVPCLPSGVARAEVVALEVLRREAFAGNAAFGDSGPYEKITGIARFAVDPRDAHNRVIVDLDLAPRNTQGKVEFAADVYILAPKEVSRGNGALFYDVNNRGGKLALRFFNTPPGGPSPSEENPAGDGYLMRRGYTVVWSGWLGEILPGEGRLLLQAPQARENGQLVRGPVRFEMCADKRVTSMPLARRDNHGSYSPTAEGEGKGALTRRLRETDPREPVPRSAWRLVRMPLPQVREGVPGTLQQIRLELEGGFEPGYLYELICECEGPIVQGLGLAGIRDLISFLRHERGERNPLRRADGQPPCNRALAFGVSQSGRCLRHLLYQGFNEDEAGRRVFDGLMPHVAGGGLGFFNHRFAQPTRHNAQHEDHLYPADVFPFTYGPSTDPFTKRTDSILGRYDAGKQPKVMHTQSAAEYWHRSGSLVHTDPLAKVDAELPANVRVYAFGGTQHGPAADPPPRGIADNLTNPGDYRPLLRSLLDALDAWVREGKEPPASVYPRLADGTLVPHRQDSVGFPAIPGVRFPEVIQQPPFADYGPKFRDTGIITREPPQVLGQYRVLVPRCDKSGNDVGTLNIPDVAVPLATYTGWNLRRKDVGAPDALAILLGSYLPFPRTRADRETTGDPRLSLEERYASFDAYRQAYGQACTSLVRRGYLLQADADTLLARRELQRGLFARPRQKVAAVPRFFATCARGLEPILAGELRELHASKVEPGRGGAHFQGDLAMLYRANLWLRTAIRVLWPILDAPVASPEELYAAVQTLDWSTLLTPEHTLAVDCNVRDSNITHSHYAALKVKDAICDQFVARCGKRPSVDVEAPLVALNLHIYQNQAVLSLDSSGDSLHKRGYRPIQTKAPLNEALAAGLILWTGWHGEVPLVDPLCGSATFCIEAAWLALRRPPGLTRRRFGFMGWMNYDVGLWTQLRDEARSAVLKELPQPIHGSDLRRDAIEFAHRNARSAGIGHLLCFTQQDLADFQPPPGPPGVIVCNPPYGERIGEEKELQGLYRSLGQVFKERCAGWRMYVFTGNARLARQIGLKPARAAEFFNGPLHCRLLEFVSSPPAPADRGRTS